MANKKTFDGNGNKDERKSADWNEGYREGWRDMRTDIGDKVRVLLRQVSACYSKKNINIGDLLNYVSRIYAYIYGSLDLFEYQMKNYNRRLSEPELRFHRVANREEMKQSFEVLTRKWSNQDK